MKVLSLLLFFFHFMKMRPLIGGINAVSLVNMHKVHSMSDCRSQNSKLILERSAFQSRTMQNVPSLDVLLPECLGIMCEQAGDLLCWSVSEQSLQVMHMSQGLRSSCLSALCVPCQQFSSVMVASQFCRLHGWHSDISIWGWRSGGEQGGDVCSCFVTATQKSRCFPNEWQPGKWHPRDSAALQSGHPWRTPPSQYG